MIRDSRLQPVVSNQSMVLFSSAAGADVITYSNTVHTPVVGPVLTILKSADQTSVSLGETLVYTLIARNEGNAPALATLVDVLPSGVSFVANSVLRDGVPLPGVSPSSGIPLGAIAPQREIRVAFQVIVVSLPPSFELGNRARAVYSFTTPEGRRVEGEVYSNQVSVSLLAYKLSILLAASTPTTFVGDAVTFTLRLRNEGTRLMSGILATIPVPEGAAFLPASVISGGIYSPDAGPAKGIPLPPLAPGKAEDISFQVRVVSAPSSSALTTRAVVTYDTAGDAGETKSNTVTVAVIQSGLSVSLKVDKYSAAPGDQLRYEFTIRNSGNLAVDAVVADAIPSGTLFIWDSVRVDGIPQRGVRPGEGIPLGTIRAGSAAVVDFLVSIPAEANILHVPAIQNQGSVEFTFTLPDGRNVRERVRSNTGVTLLVSPIISIEMTGEPPLVEPGGIAEFNITVLNSGNYPAEVSVIQIIPQGSTLETGKVTVSVHTLPESTYSGIISLGVMQPGQTIQLSYLVRVHPGYMGNALQGCSTALYLYTIDGRRYSGEARSNSYKLLIEEISE
ncbi:hypothetical protein [Paenibacillus graminis]|uniref:hypothetical protein n=1 Tax=Paenibacillus graminis TaxID=189425 RepID=UPI002DB5928A|nr:hypothetical protein [Paenibacillus graminis]MEC0167454.1 hypothetical protein [Paenibacillus graminis]